MKKIKAFFKKHWFITAILVLSIVRFLFTYKLPSFYLYAMNYDDGLMTDQTLNLLAGKYLGVYDYKMLVKGPVFPLVLFIFKLYKLNYSTAFSLLYIIACIYFIYSLKYIIKNKKYLIIIFAILLFNPVTYSSDLFQRLYRNSISIIELLFFLGIVIRILFGKKDKIYKYIGFGLVLSIMFLTREDNLWTYPVIAFIILYKFVKNKSVKTLIKSSIPILVLTLSLNIVSFINYKHYGIYTYNEIQKSEFHNTYKKILQIKDDEKKEQVSIPKSTFYKLADNSKAFNLTRNKIDFYYKIYADPVTGEIYNGNIIWYFRYMMFVNNKFKTGEESEKFYKELGKDIDKLFENGVLEKEFTMPSSFMAVPTKKNLIDVSKKVFYTIGYTATYKDIKTLTKVDNYKYDSLLNAYYFKYNDYHHTVDIVKRNKFVYEIIRILYYSLTIVFGIVGLLLYLKNIKKIDSISILSHLLLMCYLLIIGGTSYTHVTSFHAIRPLYLGNIYILQSIFIMINLYRLKKECVK